MSDLNTPEQKINYHRNLSLMVKPASSRCNMNCSYCFYKAEAGERELPDRGLLSDADAELLSQRLAEYLHPGDVLDIGFQGGEPSLLPAAFYKNFSEKLEKSCSAKIHWYFQTNGLRVNEEFCAYFREHKVLVGLSLDMEEGFHDLYRKDNAGKGTWKQVMKTKKLLDRERIDYNILSVLTPAMANHPDRVWNFIRREDLRYVQFLPAFFIKEAETAAEGRSFCCNLDKSEAKETSLCFTLTPELYADFYERMAALWLEELKKGKYYSVKLFDDLVHLLRGDGVHACGLCGSCEPQLVLEADLSVYPCDFFCTDDRMLGNLSETGIGQLLNLEKSFLNRNRILPSVCDTCLYRKLCCGGCPVLFPFTCVSNEEGSEGFCGYKKLLSMILPRLENAGLIL